MFGIGLSSLPAVSDRRRMNTTVSSIPGIPAAQDLTRMQLAGKPVTSVEFDNQCGGLLLTSSTRSGTRYCLYPWEQGLTLYGKKAGSFVKVNESVTFPFDRDSQSEHTVNDAPASIFASNIPREIRETAAPFSHAQLQVLQILARGAEPALDLARSVPVLIWLLGCEVLSNRISAEQAASRCTEKRVDIIQSIHPNSTQADLKTLQRITPQSYDKSELRIVYRLLKDKVLSANLRHLPQIVPDKVAVVMDAPEVQTIALIKQELSDPNGSSYHLEVTKNMCKTCLRFGSGAGIKNVQHTLNLCKSRDDLISLTSRWHCRYNQRMIDQVAMHRRESEAQETLARQMQAEAERQARLRRERRRERAERTRERNRPQAQEGDRAATPARSTARRLYFQPPPIPGTKYIVPITSYDELRDEGERMNHCVELYKNKILRGDAYIYKVFFIKRCTLEIYRSGKHWHIGEFRTKNNGKPPSSTRFYVREWLSGISR